jgi:putative ABC transport system ATP-binding protein/macrolide transport system ATP-binding/permease protein/lipoprotein-releasing system ATP-binding protein
MLSKVYSTPRGKIRAVDGLDLEVRSGEFLAICGRSGSGKSTLLGMLSGLCRPSDGTVQVNGVDLWSLRAGALADFRARHFGFMFQFAGLLPNLRVLDSIALPALLGGTGCKEAYRRAHDLLGQVGLGDRWDAYPGELSGGQQRRVALARALVNRPLLLLADEPTNDLDEEAERDVLALLRELHQTYHTTLLVVTHDPGLAARADRVLHLQAGRLASMVEREPAATWPVGPAAAPAPPPPVLPSGEPTLPGENVGRFLVGFVGWVLLIVALLWAGNFFLSRFQHQAIVQKQEQRKRSEELALQQLRADIDEVAYRPDGGYELRLYLNNPDPEKPFYVLGPSTHVFVQVDRGWHELPASAVDFEEHGVHAVAGKQVYAFTFRADLTHFDELIKGYLHVRISNVMVVSDHPEPGDDLFQRTDDYYIYLKPQQVSEEEVRQRNAWKPAALVPRWIAMPAH